MSESYPKGMRLKVTEGRCEGHIWVVGVWSNTRSGKHNYGDGRWVMCMTCLRKSTSNLAYLRMYTRPETNA